MPKYVVIEELHVTVLVPMTVPTKEVEKIRRIIGSRPLARRIASDVTEACRFVTTPGVVRVRVTK